METQSTSPWIWAKDKEGHRHLCPMDRLSDPNLVSKREIAHCVDDDSRLATRDYVPSNTPEGKRKFSVSASPN